MDYLLKSMLCLLALLLIHRLLLQREVLHRFNRFYLLAAVLGSFLIPLYTIEVPIKKSDPVVLESEPLAGHTTSEYESFSAVETLPLSELTESDGSGEQTVSDISFSWEKTAWVIYLAITAFFLIRFVGNLGKLFHQIRANPHQVYQGETLVLHPDRLSPFSFLKYIFISRASFEKEGISEAVFVHEQCHVHQRHSWDVLLVEALLVPFWFHPGLYAARQAIRLNHEFIADQAALGTTPVKDYQEQLLNIILTRSSQAMVSSLNFSLTKKRMQMMNKKPNSPLKWLKLLALVPLVGALVFFFGEKVEVQDEEEIVSEIQASTAENPVDRVETNIRVISERVVEVDGVPMPISELSKWLNEIKASQPVVRFSVAPGVKIGALGDVQETLREMEVRRVIYDSQGQGSGEQSEKGVYYREAYILVEDENMDYTRKTYGQLTEEERKRLLDPVSCEPTGSPESVMYEKWKDKQTYALWIDGVVVENGRLNEYNAVDFKHFFQTRVLNNARSERFPQPFQVYLYSSEYYEKEFGPNSESLKPLTDQDTITVTQRKVTWYRDIQNYPDPITAFLQKNARYEKLRTSGSIYSQKSPEEKTLLNELYQELAGEYSKATDRKKKYLKEPIAPDSDIPGNGKATQDKDEKIAVARMDNDGESEIVYSLLNNDGLQSSALKEYLTRYGQFQTKAYENHRFSQKSDWEIEALRLDYSRLQESYQRLTNDERRSVQRTDFPYAKIEKDGKTSYKKWSELSDQERKELSC